MSVDISSIILCWNLHINGNRVMMLLLSQVNVIFTAYATRATTYCLYLLLLLHHNYLLIFKVLSLLISQPHICGCILNKLAHLLNRLMIAITTNRFLSRLEWSLYLSLKLLNCSNCTYCVIILE
jgi:hypothetical protein